MKLLLKHVQVSNKLSPYNGLIKDILIIDGVIAQIEDNIDHSDAEMIDQKDLIVSQGWVDIFAHFNDPGTEYKETLESGAAAAAAGGYTNVFVLPNTKPAIDQKATVEYIIQKTKSLPVKLHPLGAISKNIEGKELAEMYDMYNSGAIAFSDGLYPVQTPGLLLKALQYVKAIDAVLIQVPIDKSIAKFGLINEGVTSTRLGLPGIPAIAEELMVSRDIELAKYTQSKIHFTGISTSKSLELIRLAKNDKLSVTCSVTPFHLFFNDEDLAEYDTNLKTDPPLRSKADMLAMRQAVEDGTVDCIASHHFPQDWDNKICEFEYAKPGMISLQTAFSAVTSSVPGISIERLVDLFTNNARSIFALPSYSIDVNSPADLTLFQRNIPYTFDLTSNKSKCKNNPFLNKQLQGKVYGIINKDKVYLNT
jgi:dihydroorotase